MKAKDRLYYHGTDIDVRLGDKVEVKRLFRRAIAGVVCYLPGVSAEHPEMQSEGVKDWAIQLEDGTVMSWIYLPAEVQPSRRIRFIDRGDSGYGGLAPDAELS